MFKEISSFLSSYPSFSKDISIDVLLQENNKYFICDNKIIFLSDLQYIPLSNHNDMAIKYARLSKLDIDNYLWILNNTKLLNTIPSLYNLKSDKIKEIIEFFYKVGKENNQEVYLVGGFVRDLARNTSSEDLDFVVVGSPIIYSNQIIESSSSSSFFIEKLREHPTFGTLTLNVTTNDGFSLKVDLATARTEKYLKPADLPSIKPANSIDDDIFRRDFTINTMAIQISPKYNVFIDKHDALFDIISHPCTYYNNIWEIESHQFEITKSNNNGFIRILHPMSFVDDPTRIYRALRFAIRFNYLISLDTIRGIELGKQYNSFNTLSGGRRLNEFKLIVQIQEFDKLFESIIYAPSFLNNSNKYGILNILFPGFTSINMDWIYSIKNNIRKINESVQWKVFCLALGTTLNDKEYTNALELSFKLPNGTIKELLTCRLYLKQYQDLCNKKPTRYNIYKLLERINEIGYCYLLSYPKQNEEYTQNLLNFSIDIKFKLKIDGNNLIDMGIPKGKQISIIKQKILEESINNEDYKTRDTIQYQIHIAQKYINLLNK